MTAFELRKKLDEHTLDMLMTKSKGLTADYYYWMGLTHGGLIGLDEVEEDIKLFESEIKEMFEEIENGKLSR